MPLQNIKSASSDIYYGNEAIKPLVKEVNEYNKLHKAIIFCDVNTATHCLPVLQKNGLSDQIETIITPEGEKSKSLESVNSIWTKLQSTHANRNTLFINLGGGIISDLGGYAASSFKRGIPYINIPTSLIGMIDASLGGKTGINLNDVKNQVGSFSFPQSIYIVPAFLKTLAELEIWSGIAEMIKTALATDFDLWVKLKNCTKLDEFLTEDKLKSVIQNKLNITNQDPYEKDIRKKLNFGHTFAHAFESWALVKNASSIKHGHAVAAGMFCESYLSFSKNILEENDLKNISNFIHKLYNPLRIGQSDIPLLLDFMHNDKKNSSKKINCTLITKPGKTLIDQEIDENEIINTLNFYINEGGRK